MAIDIDGNTSKTLPNIITATGNNPPDTYINISPATSSKVRNATFTFSASGVDASYQCKLDDAAFAACYNPIDYQNLIEGTHTFAVKAIDAAGIQDQSPASVTWTIDVTPPTGSITISASDNYTQTTSIILDFAANDPSGVTHMCISNTETCTDWQSFAPSLSWPLTTGDGLKTVRAWFRDGVGNSNVQPYTASVTLDTTSPGVALSTLKNGAATNNATLNISGTVTDTSGIKTLTINDDLVQVKADNSFSYALSLIVGANTVTTVATDLAGKTTTDIRIITYDPNAPTLTITKPMDNSRTNKTFIDVAGTIDENATVAVKVNTAQSEFAAITDNNFTYTANLAAGTNTIEITAKDLAENSTTAKRTVVYDNLSPSLAITYPAQDITTGQSSIILKGTVSDALTAVSVSITVDSQTFNPPVVNGEFEQTITFTTAKSYAITVTATDEALNSTSVQRNIIYAPQTWNNITSSVTLTKSGTLYDSMNNAYHVNITVRNAGATPINGPLRLIIINPSIPVKTLSSVGLKPTGTTGTETYFDIVPSGGTLAAGATLSNQRVNFNMVRVPLTFGMRVDQFK